MKTLTPTQILANRIMDDANTDRMCACIFDTAFEEMAEFLERMMKLNAFAAQVATTIRNKMNPYGKQVAYISSKQAWCLACAAIENDIEY